MKNSELEIPFFETSFLQEWYIQFLEQIIIDEYPFFMEDIIKDESAQKAIIAHRNFGLISMASKKGTSLFNLLDVAGKWENFLLAAITSRHGETLMRILIHQPKSLSEKIIIQKLVANAGFTRLFLEEEMVGCPELSYTIHRGRKLSIEEAKPYEDALSMLQHLCKQVGARDIVQDVKVRENKNGKSVKGRRKNN
ncbi:MAG: hypothetical protein HY063_04250 [Bacteroidetes bacterium]|nr:hypothetical protein [Bacteroidota bacterium]